MQLSPVFLVCAAGLVTFGIAQAQTPTAHAEGVAAEPTLRIAVQSLHAKQTVSGVELTGKIANTGRQTLTYTSVVLVFTNASGVEVGRGDGYLTTGPVAPGQSADFRAVASKMPAFASISLRLSEAGQAVSVQPADSRRTTAR